VSVVDAKMIQTLYFPFRQSSNINVSSECFGLSVSPADIVAFRMDRF
jgi:hypothetical protein